MFLSDQISCLVSVEWRSRLVGMCQIWSVSVRVVQLLENLFIFFKSFFATIWVRQEEK